MGSLLLILHPFKAYSCALESIVLIFNGKVFLSTVVHIGGAVSGDDWQAFSFWHASPVFVVWTKTWLRGRVLKNTHTYIVSLYYMYC